MISLSVIVPCKSLDNPQLKEFLDSVKQQEFHYGEYEVIVETEGNSEQAKAYAIQKAKGEILGFFCSDNVLRSKYYLSSGYWYASQPGVTGSYSSKYDYIKTDKFLSRYFALIGANDPLCWWLGKSDRQDYLNGRNWLSVSFKDTIPSIGDNGFFVKKSALDKVTINPDRHFPMDLCEDLRKAGEYRYYVFPGAIWHKSGENFFDYFRRRYVYTRDLYFRQREKRRWHMVSHGDWPRVRLFVLSSLLVLPHLWISFVGYSRKRDIAWFLHPVVCAALTLLYGWCYLRWGLLEPLLSSARSIGRKPLPSVSIP